jgi:hypothetical protein
MRRSEPQTSSARASAIGAAAKSTAARTLKQIRPHFFDFLKSLPGASAGAGGALHLSPQMAARLAFGSCRLGSTIADGAWLPFASTPTADFVIKFFKAASERPVFDAVQLSGIDAAGQARIFDLVYDASDPRFVITSADVTSASAATAEITT